jgi:hypothetical protein
MAAFKKLSSTRVITSVAFALGALFIYFGFSLAQTGDEGLNLPSAIESLSPANGDRVLRQSEIVVDFIDGFTGTLTIDGIKIETSRLDELTNNGNAPKPGEQVELPPNAIFDPGNYTLKFLPADGAVIEEFSQGIHQAAVRYWLLVDGETKARTYSWQFSVD